LENRKNVRSIQSEVTQGKKEASFTDLNSEHSSGISCRALIQLVGKQEERPVHPI